MSASVSFIADDHFVKLVLDGAVRFGELIQAASRVIDMHADQRCSKTLVVCDNVKLCLDAREIYSLPTRLEKLGLPAAAPVAIAVIGDTPDWGSFWFYEHIAHEQEFRHQLFTDWRAATIWLRTCATGNAPTIRNLITST